MDKNFWRERYHKDSYPAFPCPKCRNGVLKRVKERSIEHWEGKPDANGMYTEGKFSCFFECSYGFCGTVAVMSGIAMSVYEQYVDPEGDEQWQEEIYVHPKAMTPGPRIIRVPTKTPRPVKDEISKSFGLLWTDRNSAANKLRNAVEEILVGYGISKVNAKGAFIPLAKRLEDAEQQRMLHHDTLVALKDVGNTGSHEAELPFKDLIDAFDILEDALEDIYGGRKARLDGIKARLTKARRPSPRSVAPKAAKPKR
ncbi:DUF4145 domain-containing protein [Chelativorans sp. AA-79]|uniref:DUF4145 domain-containing protein n=1 Tax=Chelativorans sp. AA-79 TaxID=3028735 RepID=UPI0023F77F9B|nr:DUF4145 domain-containing protein [Chelativorans sp. AA-79]WEX11682.1 DUF4145 domain-containing protein [Chelativorans sp. AA-79]